MVALVQVITGNSPERTNSATTPSPTTSLSASATPSVAPPPSPTITSATPTPAATSPSPTAVPLADEKNTAAVPGSDTTQSSDAQTALDTLETLEVKGRAPKTGYSREQFGQVWADIDHNGCDTRNDILRRDLTSITAKPRTHGCKVITGVLDDPYTATTIDFQQGKNTSSAIQIDHVVALSDAWQTGAQNLSTTDREQLANDPVNLLAVDGPANQQKSDADAATWLPSNKDYRCTYVSKQIDVKAKYRLWVKQPEKDAMIQVLGNCGATLPEKTQDPAPVVEEPTQAPVQQATAPAYVAPPAEQAPTQQVPAQQAPATAVFANCAEARAAGAAPLYAGSPGYSSNLDGDHDGIACERK
ncbi:DUF1524 domain-containing protein (plasmid) [Rothia terrae]|uniref:DUF1524 domain-containing protein n=1 Tax=Rothia terrae TaxID=396015 RepID=A0A7S6WWE2_9MICC|nr:DUF1524 domain-containing protein [Rothia terrae]